MKTKDIFFLSIIAILAILLYLRGCNKPLPPVTIETVRWKEAKAKIKDSVVYYTRIKDSLRITRRTVIDSVKGMTDSAARKCYDSLDPQAVCEAVLTLPLLQAELNQADTIIGQYTRAMILSDSIEASQAKWIAEYQRREFTAAKGLKWHNTKEQAKGGGVVLVAIGIWEGIKLLFK